MHPSTPLNIYFLKTIYIYFCYIFVYPDLVGCSIVNVNHSYYYFIPCSHLLVAEFCDKMWPKKKNLFVFLVTSCHTVLWYDMTKKKKRTFLFFRSHLVIEFSDMTWPKKKRTFLFFRSHLVTQFSDMTWPKKKKNLFAFLVTSCHRVLRHDVTEKTKRFFFWSHLVTEFSDITEKKDFFFSFFFFF